jgi:DNA-binding CsgD family transcriptional regulator
MMTSNFESALVKKGTGWTRPERLAMAHLSYTHSFDPARGSASYVAAMAEQAVDPHDLSFDDPFSIAVTARAISTLIRAGRFDISQRLTRTALAIAQKSNLTMATAEFSTVLAHSLVAQGSLPEAEDESRRALHAAADRPWQSRPMCLAILATALIDQGRPREAAAFLDGDPSITTPKTFADLAPLEERARLRLAEGRLDEALSDLRIVRQWAETRGVRNPALTYWRFLAASALHENGRLTEAHDLAKRTVEDARTFGALWCLGAALRVAAKTSDSATERLALLTEANRVLEPSGALLEHARVSIDLGEALREDAQDAGARSALRRAADLAFRCRAQPLTDRAERALRAAGARPRRLALVGSDALTPAERRVAELAASGKNNGGIAKLLFISEKTVEGHLSRCYQKLGIRSRAELQEILDPVPAESLDAADKPSSRALGLVSLPKGNNGTPANPQRLREDA